MFFKLMLVNYTVRSVFPQLGHMSDPDDLPGLAHFCEHMLFLGTKKVRII